MRADQLVQLVTQILFVLIFLAVGYKAIRTPRRVNVDIALLFGALASLVAVGWVTEALKATPGPLLLDVTSALAIALPYLLLRLVEDFSDPPVLLSRAAALGLAVSMVSFFILTRPYLPWVTLLYVAYFVSLTVYVAGAFVRAAGSSTGVTRRRMQSVAIGSLFLSATILLAGIQAAVPALQVFWQGLGNVCALATGLWYFVGFAPPGWLRRAWQEPEVRAYLGRAATLPQLPTTEAIVRALEVGVANALGTEHAVIGLWDEEFQVLRFTLDGTDYQMPPDQIIVGRVFRTQRPIFSADTVRDNPDQTAMYQQYASRAILAAPITAGESQLGVLAVYTAHAPVFADDDLVLVTLLADQAAVILETRALIDEGARVRAMEEATRLKDDFLSAAAHDLKTPLTTMVAQAQLLAHRAKRNPAAPADLEGIERIIQQANRLKELVLELLDVSRVEYGKLVGRHETVDLVTLVGDACARHTTDFYQCMLIAPEQLVGTYDRLRLMQLLDNLLENAVKYSPEGGEVRVTLEREANNAHLTVTDQGIGIPATDLPHLFDRFYRGINVDDRQFAGLGLGLYICSGIVEQHGGRLWATSPGPGEGSAFHAVLPLPTESLETPVNISDDGVQLAAGTLVQEE